MERSTCRGNLMHDSDGEHRAGRAVRWRPRDGRDVSVAAAARAWVLAALPRVLTRPATPRLCDNVELLISELAANALQHAGGVEHIDLYCNEHILVISVHDERGAPAVARKSPPPDMDSGRGLLLVEALAARWGVREHPGDGKDVWLELALDR
ncbi:ATP-binding protein [Dactylosporangium sp. CS-047395]|uniref:ATP-binding protein n=1 Tax=Dactylosporangium sp. CS-047395 TaxID=3239936 RepID=UPI003D8C3159